MMENAHDMQFNEKYVQILEKECKNLNHTMETLEKQLHHLQKENEEEVTNIELLNLEYLQLKTELKDIKVVNDDFNKDLNNRDSHIQQLLQRYKEMKEATADYSNKCSTLQHLKLQLDSALVNIRKSSAEAQQSISFINNTCEESVQQATNEKKTLLASLQTQLKIIETRKKTLESQLQQKTDENKELIKICEDLINQEE